MVNGIAPRGAWRRERQGKEKKRNRTCKLTQRILLLLFLQVHLALLAVSLRFINKTVPKGREGDGGFFQPLITISTMIITTTSYMVLVLLMICS